MESFDLIISHVMPDTSLTPNMSIIFLKSQNPDRKSTFCGYIMKGKAAEREIFNQIIVIIK